MWTEPLRVRVVRGGRPRRGDHGGTAGARARLTAESANAERLKVLRQKDRR